MVHSTWNWNLIKKCHFSLNIDQLNKCYNFNQKRNVYISWLLKKKVFTRRSLVLWGSDVSATGQWNTHILPSLLLGDILFCIEITLGSSFIHRFVRISVSWVFSLTRPPTEKTFIKEVCFIKNIFLQGGLVYHHGCAEVHYYTRVITPVPGNTAVLKRLL